MAVFAVNDLDHINVKKSSKMGKAPRKARGPLKEEQTYVYERVTSRAWLPPRWPKQAVT